MSPRPDAIQQLERAAAMAEATHSAYLSGLTITPESLADGGAYVRGDIDIDELVRRVRARYGLSPDLDHWSMVRAFDVCPATTE